MSDIREEGNRYGSCCYRQNIGGCEQLHGDIVARHPPPAKTAHKGLRTVVLYSSQAGALLWKKHRQPRPSIDEISHVLAHSGQDGPGIASTSPTSRRNKS